MPRRRRFFRRSKTLLKELGFGFVSNLSTSAAGSWTETTLFQETINETGTLVGLRIMLNVIGKGLASGNVWYGRFILMVLDPGESIPSITSDDDLEKYKSKVWMLSALSVGTSGSHNVVLAPDTKRKVQRNQVLVLKAVYATSDDAGAAYCSGNYQYWIQVA